MNKGAAVYVKQWLVHSQLKSVRKLGFKPGSAWFKGMCSFHFTLCPLGTVCPHCPSACHFVFQCPCCRWLHSNVLRWNQDRILWHHILAHSWTPLMLTACKTSGQVSEHSRIPSADPRPPTSLLTALWLAPGPQECRLVPCRWSWTPRQPSLRPCLFQLLQNSLRGLCSKPQQMNAQP